MINNWIKCSIKDLVKIQNGYAFKSERFVKNEIPVIKISSINNNQIIIDNSETYPSINICEDFIVKKNDILIAMSGATTGKVGVYCHNNIAYLNQRVCKFVIKSNKFHYDYLRFWLNSDLFRLQMNTCLAAGAQPNLSPKQIGNMDISLPSEKNEQELITKQLIDIDSLIENLKKLIEKKKNIKLGTMQELLTGKKRLPGFNKEWEEKNLGELFNLYKGNGLSKEKLSEEGVECVLYGELFTTYKTIINKVVSKTNVEGGFLSEIGDLLMPGSTTTNGYDLATASVINKSNVKLGGDINIFRKKIDINPIFIGMLIPLLKNKIIKYTQGTTIVHLQAKQMMHELFITLPNEVYEQNAIVSLITDMEKEIIDLEQQLNKYKDIKQGMMEQLLTGKIRLA